MDIESNLQSSRFQRPYRFECQKCGKCCARSDTIVNLTFPDLILFKQEGHFSHKQLLDAIGFYIFEAHLTPEQLEKLVIPPIETQKGPAFLGLRKKADGHCIFLDSDNLCSIYSFRPSLCRTFPFFFHSKPIAEPTPHMDISMEYATKAIEYCPGIGEPYSKINPDEWLTIGKEAVLNLLQETILIQKWNKAVIDKKIKPIAENYIRIIQEFTQLNTEQPTSTDTQQKRPIRSKYRTNILKQKQTKKTTLSTPK